MAKESVFLIQQLKLINYTYKYVRYWAAIGLFSQPYGVKIKEKQLLKHLENETFEPTRVYLSSLLYKLNSKQIDKARALLSESNPE